MTTITPELRARIRQAVQDDRAGLERLLLDLVGQESNTGHEGNVQRLLAREFAARGLEVDEWIASREDVKDYLIHVGDQEIWEDRPNLVATRPGDPDAPTLMLQGHIDTVPVEDPSLWTTNPAGELKDGRIYGRGAADMKGGVASFIKALDALDAIGVRPKGTVKLATTVGEEDGGLGALSLVLRGHRADGIVITEPTQNRLVVAQGGSLVFRITITGRGAHGAQRNDGVSAFEKFIPIFQDLLDWEAERNATLSHPLYDHLPNKFPIAVGVVRSGTWASTVPEALVAEGRLGFLPTETMADMMRAAEERIATVAQRDEWLREHPPVVEWFGGQFESAEVSPETPVAMSVRRAHAHVMGSEPEIAGITAGLDLRLFTEIGGIETVTYGAGDIRYVHCPDERIEVGDLLVAVEVLAIAILDFCGIADKETHA
jgi:acetylornithine deacetylase